MFRSLVAALGLLFLTGVLPVCAQDSAKPKAEPVSPAATSGDAALNQTILSRQYKEFEQALLRLAQRMERSSRPEDRERAAVLKQAIEKASTAGIDNQFEKLIATLKSSNAASLQSIQEAMAQNKSLADDLQTLLALLRSENRDDFLKEEKKRLEALIKMLDKVIRDEKTVRAKTEGNKTEKNTLVREQKKVTKSTEEIAKEMSKGKKGEGEGQRKPGDAKPSPPKPAGEGQPKPPSDGQPKPAGDGQPKPPGESQPKPPSDGQPPPPDDGRKQVQDAVQGQKKAEQEIEKDKKDEAAKTQDKVIQDLEAARKKLEAILKQLREEELERILAALQARCERMLAMQIAVRDDTGRVADDIVKNPEKKPTRANEQKSLDLSKREDLIVVEANKAIEILAAEGSAVAFPEVFYQVRDDMKNVSARLLKVDVGVVTQTIEDDIIATLKDMIEALKKAQQKLRDQKNPPPPGQPPPSGNQPLIDQIAELKMIRAMQVRVNARTVTYAREYQGEQAPAPESGKLEVEKAVMIQRELRNLGERQLKIYEVVRNIATGKNK